jgi:putative DNA methylase
MRDEALTRIGHLYPQATLSDGSTAKVTAWLWARTVKSPNPIARGAQVPLVSSFVLSTRESNIAWVETEVDASARDGWRFVVERGTTHGEDEKQRLGQSIEVRGTCVLTRSPMLFSYIREQGQSVGLGIRLMAIIAEGLRGRIYLSPDLESEKTALLLNPEWEPEGDLPNNPRNFNTPIYGLRRFRDLFSSRQIVALTTFADLVTEARENALADARMAALPPGHRLADQGVGRGLCRCNRSLPRNGSLTSCAVRQHANHLVHKGSGR